MLIGIKGARRGLEVLQLRMTRSLVGDFWPYTLRQYLAKASTNEGKGSVCAK